MDLQKLKPNANNPRTIQCTYCLGHFEGGYKTFTKKDNLCRACYKRKLRNGTAERKRNNDGFYKDHEREANSYENMIQRCTNSKHDSYQLYGGRGIDVDERWRGVNGFKNFVQDMGLRPVNTSLERRDNSLGYYKDNCRWASPAEQMRNTRRNRNLTIFGKTMCMMDWAKEYNIHWRTLLGRLNTGWDLERAITEPVHRRPYVG